MIPGSLFSLYHADTAAVFNEMFTTNTSIMIPSGVEEIELTGRAGYVTSQGSLIENTFTQSDTALIPVNVKSLTLEGKAASVPIQQVKQLSSLPEKRCFHGCETDISGNIYVIGGLSNDATNPTNSVLKYIREENRWATVEPLPTKLYHAKTYIDKNNMIYVVGGTNGSSYVSSVYRYNTITNTWAILKPMNYPRYYHALTVDSQGRLYAIGGISNNGLNNYTSTVERYDPTTDTWVVLTSLNTARCFSQASSISNGKIYVIGGVNSSSATLSSVEIYDPATNTWSFGNSMTSPRMSSSSTYFAIDEKEFIYAIGGSNDNAALATCERYNPKTNVWSSIASLNDARTNHSSYYLNDGYIYVSGGRSAQFIERYDIKNNKWERRQALLEQVENFGTALYRNEICLVGGSQSGAYTGFVQSYTTQPSIAWQNLVNLPESLSAFGSLITNNFIYVIGGYKDSDNMTALNTFYRYNISQDEWVKLPDAPISCLQPTLFIQGNKLYVYGGYASNFSSLLASTCCYDIEQSTWTVKSSTSVPHAYAQSLLPSDTLGRFYHISGKISNGAGGYTATSICERFDPSSESWTALASLNIARQDHRTINDDSGNIYVIGGVDGSGTSHIAICEKFNPVTNSWSTIASLPTPRKNLTLIRQGSRIYAIGGRQNTDSLSTVECYDIATNSWSSLAPMQTARHNCSAILDTIKNRIYIFSGTDTQYYKSIEVYDIAKNKWTYLTMTDINFNNYSHILKNNLSDGNVYISTGNGEKSFRKFDIYKESLWEPLTAPSLTRGYSKSILDKNQENIYIFGGNSIVSGINTLLKNTEKYSLLTNTYTAMAPMNANHYLGTQDPLTDSQGNIIILSGKTSQVGNELTTVCEKYDPTTNTWSYLSSIPQAMWLSNAVIDSQDNIYVLGGMTSVTDPSTASDTVYRYSPSSNTWSSVAALPRKKYGAKAILVNNKIYSFGGYAANQSILKSTDIFDITSGTWSSGLDSPAALISHNSGIAAYGNFIYLIGGLDQSTGQTSSQAYRYTITDNTWTTLSSLTIPRYAFDTIVDNYGRLYSIGGMTQQESSLTNVVERYDPLFGSWKVIASLPEKTALTSSIRHGNDIYLINGYSEVNTTVSQLIKYTISDVITNPSYAFIGDIKYSFVSSDKTSQQVTLSGAAAIGITATIINGGFITYKYNTVSTNTQSSSASLNGETYVFNNRLESVVTVTHNPTLQSLLTMIVPSDGYVNVKYSIS